MVSDLHRFGRWVVVANVIVFASLQIDNVVVGRLLGAPALGLYEMAFRISQLPTTQVTGAISIAVYPMLSRLASDPDRFTGAYLKVVSVLFIVNLSLSLIVVIFADFIVQIMLGPQWMEIVPILRILAVAGFLRSMVQLGGRVLYALGKPGWDSLVSATRLVALAVMLVPFAEWRGVEGVAIAVVVSSFLIVPVYLINIWKLLGVSPTEHFGFALGFYRRAVRLTRNQIA
jgi:O-antigen/teichoic acid export membrane protein